MRKRRKQQRKQVQQNKAYNSRLNKIVCNDHHYSDMLVSLQEGSQKWQLSSQNFRLGSLT